MARAYPKEFRESALKALERVGDIEEVCILFGIKRSALYRWRKMQIDSGDVSPKQRSNKPRKANYAQLEELVANNHDIMEKDIAKIVNMSCSGVGRALKKIGIF